MILIEKFSEFVEKNNLSESLNYENKMYLLNGYGAKLFSAQDKTFHIPYSDYSNWKGEPYMATFDYLNGRYVYPIGTTFPYKFQHNPKHDSLMIPIPRGFLDWNYEKRKEFLEKEAEKRIPRIHIIDFENFNKNFYRYQLVLQRGEPVGYFYHRKIRMPYGAKEEGFQDFIKEKFGVKNTDVSYAFDYKESVPFYNFKGSKIIDFATFKKILVDRGRKHEHFIQIKMPVTKEDYKS